MTQSKLSAANQIAAPNTVFQSEEDLISLTKKTNQTLNELVEQLKTLNSKSDALLKLATTGFRVQEPVVVEVDGVVAVVGH